MNVSDAAYVKLDPNSAQGAILDDIMSALGAQKVNMQDLEEPQVSDEPCFCPSCFNFESFESVLGETGSYDYKTVTLGGKEFQIKYYNGKYQERIMMQEKEWSVPANWTYSMAQQALNQAVQSGEFDKAQKLLNHLNKFKN